jgi:hypothetical protein
MGKISNANGPSNNPDLAAAAYEGVDPNGQNFTTPLEPEPVKLASPLDVPNSTEHPVSERYAELGPGVVSTTLGSGPDMPASDAELDQDGPGGWPAARATRAGWHAALVARGVSDVWMAEPDPEDAPGRALTKDQMQGVAHGLDSGELGLDEDGIPVDGPFDDVA